jgi:hypothetical protein
MHPVITIVTALTAGATATNKVFGNAEVDDAYARLERLIGDQRYRHARKFVKAVEAHPSSELDRQELVKQLSRAGAAADGFLMQSAQKLLCAVLTSMLLEPEAAALFDFEPLCAARDFELEEIHYTGGAAVAAR